MIRWACPTLAVLVLMAAAAEPARLPRADVKVWGVDVERPK